MKKNNANEVKNPIKIWIIWGPLIGVLLSVGDGITDPLDIFLNALSMFSVMSLFYVMSLIIAESDKSQTQIEDFTEGGDR